MRNKNNSEVIFKDYELFNYILYLVAFVVSLFLPGTEEYFWSAVIFYILLVFFIVSEIAVSCVQCRNVNGTLIFQYLFNRKKIFEINKITKVVIDHFSGKYGKNWVELTDDRGSTKISFNGSSKSYFLLKQHLENCGLAVTEYDYRSKG